MFGGGRSNENGFEELVFRFDPNKSLFCQYFDQKDSHSFCGCFSGNFDKNVFNSVYFRIFCLITKFEPLLNDCFIDNK